MSTNEVFPRFLSSCTKIINIFPKSLNSSVNLTSSSKFLSHKTFSMAPKKAKGKGDKVSTNTEIKNTVQKSPVRTDTANNILIEVYAKPGAKQNAIVEVSDEGINVQINAPPVEGSANTELVKYMASFLGLKSSNVSLERGHKSRNKVLKISGNITKADVVKKINDELPAGSKLPEDG